jgi:hypothetical protein
VSEPFPSPTVPASSRSEVFLRYLDFFRSRVTAKVADLPDAELRSSRLPSGWTPGTSVTWTSSPSSPPATRANKAQPFFSRTHWFSVHAPHVTAVARLLIAGPNRRYGHVGQPKPIVDARIAAPALARGVAALLVYCRAW